MDQTKQTEILREVHAAIAADDLGRAEQIARVALDDGFVHPMVLNLRAAWLEKQGQFADALADLERAREIAPQDYFVHNAIGECLAGMEQLPEAIAAFDAALQIHPGFSRAHYNKGFACERLREHDLAERCYLQVERLEPNHSDALSRLAGLAARRSDWIRTRLLANRALALAPGSSIALFALATADLNEGSPDSAEARLRIVLDDASMTKHERANAFSLLGDIRDRQDRPTEAFAAYEEANALLQEFFAPQYGIVSNERTEALLSRLSNAFEAAPADAWNPPQQRVRAGDEPSAGLVFLVGFPRSGTTLLGQILASHPGVVTFEEKVPFIDAIKDFFDAPDGFGRLPALDQAGVAHYRNAYWKRARSLGQHLRDKIVVDKLPLNILRLPAIAKIFPDAKVVLAMRDPRDVVLSCFRRLFAMHQFSYDMLTLEGTARSYAGTMALTQVYRSRLPIELLEVRNEAVVADFDGEVRRLCDFIGIPWNRSMEKFADRAKRQTIGTPSATQIARGLSSEGVGTWRRYAKEVAPVLPILAPWVEAFGYAPDTAELSSSP